MLIQIAQFRPDDWLNESVKFPAREKFEVTGTDDGCVLAVRHPGGGKAAVALSGDEVKKLIEKLENI